MKMRLSNLPDDVTDRMIEDQSAEVCVRCEGEGVIETCSSNPDDESKEQCLHCNGSGVEPKRFISAKPDSWED